MPGERGTRAGHERVEFEEPLLEPFKFRSVDWSCVLSLRRGLSV